MGRMANRLRTMFRDPRGGAASPFSQLAKRSTDGGSLIQAALEELRFESRGRELAAQAKLDMTDKLREGSHCALMRAATLAQAILASGETPMPMSRASRLVDVVELLALLVHLAR